VLEYPDQERFDEALGIYQEAQEPADYDRAVAIFLELLGKGELPTPVRHYSMLLGAECLNLLRRFHDAQPLLRQLLQEIKPEPDENQGVAAAATLALAVALRNTGACREAIDYFSTSARYFHEKGDWASEANVHHTVALLWQQESQLDRTEASLDVAWAILQSHEPTSLHLQVLFSQGHCCYLKGDLNSAIRFEENALVVARRIEDTTTESQLIQNLAKLTFDLQEFRQAIHYNEAKLKYVTEVGSPQEIAQTMTILGCCYSETGNVYRSIEVFGKAQALFSQDGQEKSLEYALCLIGKAQALVDLKSYDEAKPLLAEARELYRQHQEPTGLIDRIERRSLREAQAPLRVDCAHRVLQIALSGSSRDTDHQNPQPSFDLTTLGYLTTNLIDVDRNYLARLHRELQSDLFQLQYSGSRNEVAPGTLFMPAKYEYVEDVESFEIKWNAYKQEVTFATRCQELQEEWDQIRKSFSFAEGQFRGDKTELLEYVTQLSQIAEISAELGNRELLRSVSLHAADFLELETSDPMLAVLVWPVRARLIIAAHLVATSSCRQHLEVELRRSFGQISALFGMLGPAHRAAALQFVVEPWFTGASKILRKEGFSGLVELVGELSDVLDPTDRLRYAIAVGEASSPQAGVQIVDPLLGQIRLENPRTRITLAPEFEIAIAIQRFKALAPNLDACRRQYGPYAKYIHNEVLGWDTDIFQVSEFETISSQPLALAYSDENLVVMDKRLKDIDYVATTLHEMMHQGGRAGQQLRTVDGDWLLLRRDVPTASALTYFLFLDSEDVRTQDPLVVEIQALIELGRRHVASYREESGLHVKNMLRYFDDLGTHETRASYSCAALLLGMAFGYLVDRDKVWSYLEHLQVMDHDEALVYGSRKASLSL
jgi:tetratricopeptide (TPR) repeat protein